MNEITTQKPIDQNEINWSSEELKKWFEAGLVPEELLPLNRFHELNLYLLSKKEILYACYRLPEEEKNYQIKVPPNFKPNEDYELQVVDKRTGKVVSTLNRMAHFNLCEDINLEIRAIELDEWEKETADAKQLTIEQNKELKAFLSKSQEKKRPLTRKEIVTFLEEIRKPPKTFRQSSDLIDNKLDRDINNQQLTIFDFSDLKGKKNEDISSEKPIIKGLDLDQGEDRIVHTLTLLLSKKSENRNQKSPYYYMGNYEKGSLTINEIEMETARMTITPHELYSTYYGKENYGSDQTKYILKKLDSLSKKMFSTTWNVPIKPTKKGDKIKFNKLRTYFPLFQIFVLNKDLSESESQAIDNNTSLLEGKNCLFLFKFQPIFTNNIRERYVEFPEDIHLRISDAVGKDRYASCINLMRDLLFREKSSKRYEILRDKETLIGNLKLYKFWKENRKKKVNEMILECLKVFKKIGLIVEWEETRGVLGQAQYKMQIDKNFK